MQFALNEDQIAVRDMARDFAAEKIAPHALRWDEEKHFPVDVMREAATLGIGGIYIRDDVGGSAMTRFDAALIFEALAQGCPTVSAFISIHNMASWMIDAYRQRHPAPEVAAEALHHGADRKLLPDRAGLRLGCGGAAHPRGARRRSLRAQRPEAVHLRRRRRRPLCRDGADRRRRPRRHLDAGGRGRHARALVRRQRAQDGLERAADPRGDLRECPRAGRKPAGRGGHRLQDRDGRPRRRPHQYRGLFARRRAERARQVAAPT